MKIKLFAFLTLMCGVSMVLGLASCGDGDKDPTTSTVVEEKHTVSYYDGSNVIHTEEVNDGAKAPAWDPSTTITDKEFFGWYGEPTLTHAFDFDTLIEDDTSIFGSFVGYQKDTRKWALAGSGSSELLKQSNWGKVYNEGHYMTNESTDSKNIYTIEINLFANDQFQFTDPVLNSDTGAYSWGHQRGGGYLVEPTRDEVEYFQVGGGLGADNYTANITAKVDGRYKFTLTTYPAGDFQKDDSPETYNNRSYYDTLEWVRVGDSTETLAETTIQFFMKGAKITSWANLYNDHTLMVESDDIHTLNHVYLTTDDEFMFASRITTVSTGEVSDGNEYIRGSNLTDESKTLISGEGNMKVLANGYYSFSYDHDAAKLTVTKDDDYNPTVAYYYVDGNFGGRNWGIDESLKLVQNADNPEVYELSAPITVSEADQQMGIQFYNAELSSPYVDFFGAKYVASANDAYDIASGNNIIFKTAGSYNVSINTYSHIITITAVA